MRNAHSICETCGHDYTKSEYHGMELTMRGECTECWDCINNSEYEVILSNGIRKRVNAASAADARNIVWHQLKGTAISNEQGVNSKYHMATGKDIISVEPA